MASSTLLSAPSSATHPQHSDSFLPLLDEARRAVARTRSFVLMFASLSAVIGLLAVMVILDYWLVLPTAIRALWLAATLVVSIALFVRTWRRWIAPLSAHRVAAEMERHQPALGQRLRTVADYDDPQASPAPAHAHLVTALRDDSYRVVTNRDFEELPAKEPLTRSIAVFASVIAVAALLLMWNRELRLAAGRTLLLPWHYTTVTFTPTQAVLKQGENLVVKTTVAGRPIETANLRYRERGATDWKTIALQPAKGAQPAAQKATQLFAATIANCQRDFQFQVAAGPTELPLVPVQVLQPLLLNKTVAEVSPPEYLHLPAEVNELKSLELKVLEGSTVALQLQFSRAPQTAVLNQVASAVQDEGTSPADPAAPLALQLDGAVGRIQLADLRESATYTIAARAADGIEMETARFRIRVLADNKPRVQFVSPDEQIEVTPTTEVPLTLAASDDQGLMKVGILYQIGDGPLETLYEEPFEKKADPLQVSRTLMLEDHRLTFQDQITYYAFAEDNYFGKPRRNVTPLRFIDIRPYKRDFQMIEGGGGSCNGSSVTLEELIARQRNNLGLTFIAAEQSALADSARQRLLTNERELHSATSEFASGLAMLGHPVPELDTAVAAMQSAVAKLELQPPDIKGAMQDQQSALTSLVRARQNLRKLFSDSSSSSSSSACRTFDRQQKQKLRTPEQRRQDQQQQLAEQRQQLNQLAQKQKQWSEEVRSGEKSIQLDQDNQQQQQQQAQQQNQNPKQNSSASSSSSSQSQSASQSTASQQSPQNSPSLAEQQRQMIEQLRQISERLEQLNSATDSLPDRAAQIGQQMQNSVQELENQRQNQAAQQAASAASDLEHLADFLAAMTSEDFLEGLAQAQLAAQDLARRQQSVGEQLQPNSKPGQKNGDSPEAPHASSSDSNEQASQPGGGSEAGSNTAELAEMQRAYATKAKMLSELITRLRATAFGNGSETQQALDELAEQNSPQEIAQQMQETADQIAAGEHQSAAANATDASQRLDEIAEQIRRLRGELTQPRLDDLVQLEEQLSQLLQQIKNINDSASFEQAIERFHSLSEQLAELASSDSRISEALRAANQQAQNAQTVNSSTANPDSNPVAPGFYTRNGLPLESALRGLNGILQTKIQEIILAGAEMDVDDAVPPEYKDLVEEYYRQLSDDLRE